MVTLSAFVSIKRIYGVDQITRYNMYPSVELNGEDQDGFSNGDAIKAIQDVAKTKLPKGFDIDWAGITRDEVSAGNEAIYVFLICLVFVVISTIREFFTAFACYFIFANGHIWCIHIGFGKQYLRPSRYDYVDWSFG